MNDEQYSVRARITEHLITAFFSAMMVGMLGWAAGFVDGFIDMRHNMMEQGKSLAKMEVNVANVQKDVSDLKMGGFQADANLDKRVAVTEEQYKTIISQHNEMQKMWREGISMARKGQ